MLTEYGKLKSTLLPMLHEDPGFSSIQKWLACYCPFEAIGMVHSEIRHSTFLAHCLDPYRPHGFGPDFLRAFLDVAGVFHADDRIDVLDLTRVDVRKEWRRIDLLLVLPDDRIVIAIEMKIGASEGGDQLNRYSIALEDVWPATNGEWRHVKLFLTRAGDEPSEPSWTAIDYGVVIEAVMKFESSSDTGVVQARDMLRSYADMLMRHHMNNEAMESLAIEMWERHSEALTFLMRFKPGGIGDLISRSSDELASFASDENFTLVPLWSNASWTTFYVKEWSSIEGMNSGGGNQDAPLLIIEIESHPQFIKFFISLKPGNHDYRLDLYNKFLPILKKKKLSIGKKTICSDVIISSSTLNSSDNSAIFDFVKLRLRDWVKKEVLAVNNLIIV